MLTSAVTSCLRTRGTASATRLRLALSGANWCPSHVPVEPRVSSRLLTPDTWFPLGAPAARSVALSAPRGGDNVGEPVDSGGEENFGSLSGEMSSRRWFRKTSPHVHDLRHQEEEEGDKDGEAGRPGRRPGRRNNAYWYFLRCKKLIKENKVRAWFDESVSSHVGFIDLVLCVNSCRRLWTCSPETCCWRRGCSRRR